jgi:hypothetical protein
MRQTLAKQSSDNGSPVDLRDRRVAVGELGVTGLTGFHGQIQEEFLTELRGRRGMRTYNEMRLNDPVVGAILYAVEYLARGVTWTLEAADDSTPAAEVREFVHSALFQDMNQSWTNLLSEIITLYPFGWSYFEVIYKTREGEMESPDRRSRFDDKRWGWRKWAIRGQDTVERWLLDPHGGIHGIEQRPTHGGGLLTIPIEKSVLFRSRTERNNPEGRSILRNAYRPWYFKKRIEEIEGIGIERDLAGLPVIQPDEDTDLWNTQDTEMVSLKAATEKLIRNLKRDRQEGVLLPPKWQLTLLSTGSRRQFDTTQIIERYDTRIALSVLADFVLIGHQVVGSFALHADKTHLFALALGGQLDNIADVINAHVIPTLTWLNGWPRQLAPRLVHGDLETPDLQALAGFVSTLTREGVIRTDPEMERRLRDLAGLPPPPDRTAEGNAVQLRRYAKRLSQRERALIETMTEVRDGLRRVTMRRLRGKEERS